MPFYIRKSVRAGPFRFNLSKSGLGVSVGVKGFRVGTGPRGHYVHAGRGGLYYRASLGSSRGKQSSVVTPQTPPSPAAGYAEQDRVDLTPVQSDDVAAMRDAAVSDLLTDLSKKQAQVRIASIAATSFAAVGILALFVGNTVVGIIALIGVIPAWAVGKWLDSYKRTSVLFYSLEGPVEDTYKKVTESFDRLAACSGKWYIAARGAVRDSATQKRNAGATQLVDRKVASLTYGLPKILRSNVTPPAMTLGARTFYFFPEVTIVQHGRQFGAVSYGDLLVKSQTSHFVESDTPPRDGEIVDHTWQHPNKSGGPDKRFVRNRQLPILRYEEMHLSSESGVNEHLQFSRTGVVEPFSDALMDLPRRQTAVPT